MTDVTDTRQPEDIDDETDMDYEPEEDEPTPADSTIPGVKTP